jgi:hypothetical protein
MISLLIQYWENLRNDLVNFKTLVWALNRKATSASELSLSTPRFMEFCVTTPEAE